MKLYRLDATHELDGAFCRFYREHDEALVQVLPLSAGGWLVDVYPVDLSRIGAATIEMLCGTLWPNTSEENLIGYVEHRLQAGPTPVQAAQESLARILNSRIEGKRKAKKTHGGNHATAAR